MHYCGGELVSISINKEAKTCCAGTGGCCKNKTLHFKVKGDYTGVVQMEYSKLATLALIFPILFTLPLELNPLEEKYEVAFYDGSPPHRIQARLALWQTYLC